MSNQVSNLSFEELKAQSPTLQSLREKPLVAAPPNLEIQEQPEYAAPAPVIPAKRPAGRPRKNPVPGAGTPAPRREQAPLATAPALQDPPPVETAKAPAPQGANLAAPPPQKPGVPGQPPPPSPAAQFKNLLTQYEGELSNALDKRIGVERFIRTALTAASNNPKIFECTKTSILSALLTSAQLGIEPDDGLGKAYLIPYYNNKTGHFELEFIIGYKGLVDLALRGNQVKAIHADVVYKGDFFDYIYGTESYLKHRPQLSRPKEAKIEYAYSVVKLANGESDFRVMGIAEVEDVRAMSKSPNSPAWVKHFPEMAKKTVFRQHSKMLQLSSEYQLANLDDMRTEFGNLGKEIKPKDGGGIDSVGAPDLKTAQKPQDAEYTDVTNN